jgi:acyl-CoA reductase-like NAD-dependent aldehyde dehydrogenase
MDFTLTIDGKGIASAESLSVLNPATGKELAQCPRATPELLEQAVSAAARVAEHWGRSKTLRSAVLLECTKIFQDCKDELANLIRLETGKPHCHAVGEVEQGLASVPVLRRADRAGLPGPGCSGSRPISSPPGRRRGDHAVELPLSLAVRKIAPALRAGNAVVLKPSPYAPLATLRLGEKLREALPGILNVVAGGDDLGMTLCTHPKVDMISFTGSHQGRALDCGRHGRSMKSLCSSSEAMTPQSSSTTSI